MSQALKNITARLQGTKITAAPGEAAAYSKMLEDMSKTFGPAKASGTGHMWKAADGKCSLVIWVREPKNGMVKGRVELHTPFTEMMEKLDTSSGSGYIRAEFGEGKISDFKTRVLAHLKNEATAQKKDIDEDQKALKFLGSFK